MFINHYNIRKVTRYGYREACPASILFELGYDRDTPLQRVQIMLAKMANSETDNHETYVIETDEGEIVVKFSDWCCYIGTGLTLYS